MLVETIAIFIDTKSKPKQTIVESYVKKITKYQKQNYIFDTKFPYWIIYRDEKFDEVCSKLEFNFFEVFRDRQITNSLLASEGDIRVLKSRNISDNGKKIESIKGYDAYISFNEAKSLSVFAYYNAENVYISPNMTYKPRVMKKPKKSLVNGSLAILIPKRNIELTEEQLEYFSTNEYREFYHVARNYQTRSLNIDSCSVFFYGLLKK